MHTQGCRVAGNVDPQVAMRGERSITYRNHYFFNRGPEKTT